MANEVGIFSPDLAADDFPSRLPDGIISFQSGAAVGSFEVEPYINMKVCLGRSKVHCLLTPFTARDIIDALQEAIEQSEELALGAQSAIDETREEEGQDSPVSHEEVLADIKFAKARKSPEPDPFLKALGDVPSTTRPARS